MLRPNIVKRRRNQVAAPPSAAQPAALESGLPWRMANHGPAGARHRRGAERAQNAPRIQAFGQSYGK